jgi:hypothetical protein
MTTPQEQSAPASKHEPIGEAKDPSQAPPTDETAASQQRPCWSPADILAIARTLRVR